MSDNEYHPALQPESECPVKFKHTLPAIPRDLKEGLSSNRKPDITHVRYGYLTYTSRPAEFGCVKYERANFLRPSDGVVRREPNAADFARFRKYLRAGVSHAMLTLDAMERHQALDPQLQDVEGMKRAAYAVDTDESPTAKFTGPSNLPHIAPACTSMMMAIEQAIDCGLLPADPGESWKDGVPAGWRDATPTQESAFAGEGNPR